MKFFQTILKRIVSIVIVILMCFICIKAPEEKEEQVQIPIEEDIEETSTEEETIEVETIEEAKTEPLEEFSYYIKSANLYDSYYSYIYDLDIESNRDLYMPVPLVEIRGDKEKEKHLNALILERCNSVLPKEKTWMDYAELKITFRSEKYLCFEYISHAAIPEDYDYKQLYFTLDLEEERWEEYPVIETEYTDEYRGRFFDGGVEEELEEFQGKTVEEQNILRGDTGYDVYEQIITCEGISTSCVQVRGLEDLDKEKQINQLLQEPLISLIQSEGTEDYDKFWDGVFEDIKIYVAYKTEKWLSVVYSIRAERPSKQTGKGLAELGITINMQTGERVMLDDLFSLQDLEGWLVGQEMNEVYFYNDNIHATFLTEEEIINKLDVKGQRALLYYNTALTFFLHRGELVFMDALFVNEIPLPEIYEYLKVDPWYDEQEKTNSTMQTIYQELVESAQYDWEWVIEPGEYGDFAFFEEYEDGNKVIQEAGVVTECQYDKVKDYSEGLAAVEKDGKWGYIDQTGQVVIELMYDDAGSFSEGKAAVALDNYFQDGLKAWAYINPENTVVIDWFPCYGGAAFREYAGEFHDGLAFVLREIPTIINENGEEVFESYFFISDYVYDSKYKAIPAYVFTDDLMTERKYGLVGLDGKCLIEPVFDWIWEPHGDYVRVEMIVEGKRCEGVIRIKGKAEEVNNTALTETEAEQIVRRADKTIQMMIEKPKIFFTE